MGTAERSITALTCVCLGKTRDYVMFHYTPTDTRVVVRAESKKGGQRGCTTRGRRRRGITCNSARTATTTETIRIMARDASTMSNRTCSQDAPTLQADIASPERAYAFSKSRPCGDPNSRGFDHGSGSTRNYTLLSPLRHGQREIVGLVAAHREFWSIKAWHVYTIYTIYCIYVSGHIHCMSRIHCMVYIDCSSCAAARESEFL